MRKLAIGVLALSTFAIAGPALAADDAARDPALDELIEILRQRGVLEARDEQAIEKAAAESKSWYDELASRVDLWGDFRGRYEYFSFFHDPVNAGDQMPDRHRLRYRLRFNAKGHVNDYSEVFIRLATGNDSRSTNQTFGDGVDFATNEIFLDKAYVRASAFPNGALPSGDGTLWGYFGRTEQPWRWGIYKDWIWDDELSPAGLYLQGDKKLSDSLKLFGSGGFYVIDENGSSKDPEMLAGQLGVYGTPARDADGTGFAWGSKISFWNFFNLDSAFLQRGIDSTGTGAPTFAAGNTGTPGQSAGLTGDRRGGHTTVLEYGTYATLYLIEQWPVTLHGNISYNFGAESVTVVNAGGPLPGTFRADDQPLFWLLGLTVGDKKQNVKFDVSYAWMEANAMPAQFIDSDLHDGVTNRKGWVWSAGRTVFENVDAELTAFLSDSIKNGGAYANSLAGSDRFRLQANFIVSF